MEFHNGVVWQVGDRGMLYTSADLDQWTPRQTGTDKSLRGITFLGDTAVISGEEGTILVGTDPNQLASQSISTTNWLESVAASDSMLVAVGDNGSIYSSTGDGTWSRRGSYTNWLRGVEYGENKFLCVGEDGFIAQSGDGKSWTKLNSGTTAHLNRVRWLNGTFWVVGDRGTVLTNNPQMTFSPVNLGITNTLFTITANASEIVIAGDSAVMLRDPATGNWIAQADLDSPELAPVWPYYSSLWDGRLFLLGGHAGMQVEGFRTNSTAPLIWYSDIQATRSWLWGITRATDFFAAVGADGSIVTSDDGVEWARESVPQRARGEVLLGVGGNTNVLIAAGSNGIILRSENVFTNLVQTNASGGLETNMVNIFGLNWLPIQIATTEDLQGVAANQNTIIVTGGAGAIFTSLDGKIWLPRFSGVTTYLSGATAWPQGFVVVGASGVILTSSDGNLWQKRTSGTQDWVYAVRWVGGKLVAVGENGMILTSDNGVNWTRRESATTQWLNDVSFAKGTWFVAGSRGTIVTSTDASIWRASRAITANSLYGAASNGDNIVMVGTDGTILRKTIQPVLSPVNIAAFEYVGGNSVFLFGGVVDQQFILEEASAVTGPWTPGAELELTQPPGTLIYERPLDNDAIKFFRTRVVPTP